MAIRIERNKNRKIDCPTISDNINQKNKAGYLLTQADQAVREALNMVLR